jgi:plastocyanin
MRFSTLFTASAIAGAAMAKEITVTVGKGANNLTFDPAEIQAAEGDTIMFHFYAKNHSVVQAAFAKPCEPLANGAWSGFVPTTSSSDAAETAFMMNVTNATAPIWLYCSQGKHCQSGMVAVVNPP